MTDRFWRCTITKVPRAENSQADALAMLVSSCAADTPSGGTVKTTGPSVNLGVLTVDEEEGSWINKIIPDAHLRTLAYRRAITKLYNHRVHPRLVKMGDLVLRKAEVSDPTRSRGKLAPNWEDPCQVVEVVREGT
ncbi:hypothetical protein GW17_00056597 [Ensete ventricosum]|nr:hypothetical protein GW17_00056597 [Ensete ventricosum]